MAEWSSYISGLKWIGLNDLLYDTADHLNLSLVVTANPRGLIRETIHFTVKGETANINKFSSSLAQSIHEYNTPVEEAQE